MREEEEGEQEKIYNIQKSNKQTELADPVTLKCWETKRPPTPHPIFHLKLNTSWISRTLYHLFALESDSFKALGTYQNRNNLVADLEGSCLHPWMCLCPPTWIPPHPSLGVCQGWHPSIASLHSQESSGNNEVFQASDSVLIQVLVILLSDNV